GVAGQLPGDCVEHVGGGHGVRGVDPQPEDLCRVQAGDAPGPGGPPGRGYQPLQGHQPAGTTPDDADPGHESTHSVTPGSPTRVESTTSHAVTRSRAPIPKGENTTGRSSGTE